MGYANVPDLAGHLASLLADSSPAFAVIAILGGGSLAVMARSLTEAWPILRALPAEIERASEGTTTVRFRDPQSLPALSAPRARPHKARKPRTAEQPARRPGPVAALIR